MKKTIISILLISMLAGSLSACIQKEQKTDSSEEKLEITWMGVPYNPSAQEGVQAELAIEERFNVEIKPIFLTSNNYNDKKSMMMASGEIPDLIYELDPINVSNDVAQGLLAKVPYKTIKSVAPTLYNELNKEAPQAWLYSRVGEENYGVPNLNYNNMYPHIGIWRLDWLKNVGIDKVPETIDEMGEALYRFKYNDPDGNGKDDTYGMSGDIKHPFTMFTNIFGAYGVLPFNWMEVNGKIVYGGLQEGTKQAVAKLAEWYGKGLIHPDFITDDIYSTGKDKFINGIVGCMPQHGGYFDPENTNSIASLTKQIDSKAEVVNCKPVIGPTGKSGTHVWSKACHIVSFGAQLEKQPEKLERILKIFEASVTDESFGIKLRLGDENVHWEYMDKEKGFDGGVKFLPPFDDSNQQKNECLTGDFGAPSFFAPIAAPFEIYMKHRTAETKAVYTEYSDVSKGMPDVFGKADTLPSASKYYIDLRTQQINLMVQIIKGEKPNSAYAEFEQMWQTQGGLELEKEAQEMKELLNTIYQEIEIQ